MEKIKCIIVDDEPVAQRILEGYLQDLKELELVAICNNAMEANEILENHDIDLMFLDIEMPRLKGLDFIRILTNSPSVIITTAHREFALDSFELEVLDYLLKPISFDRFLKAVMRYKKLFNPTNNRAHQSKLKTEFLYAKSNRKMAKIPLNNILFIEGMSNYVKVISPEKNFVIYTSMSSLLEELNDAFVRIHKSYIINKNKVSFFTKEFVEINNRQLPIGKTYQEKILDQL